MPSASVQGGGVGFTSITGSIAAGTGAFTDTNGNFAASNVGNNITIKGAGAGGADYQGTITAFTSPTAVTVSPNAGTTVVANAPYLWGPAGGVISSNWTTTIKVTLATGQSVGDGIACGCNDDAAHGTPSFSDTAGNTFTQRGSTISNADYQELIFTAAITHASGSGANTITCTFSALEAGFSEMFWRHFSNVGAFSQVKNSSSTGASVTTGNFGSSVLAGSVIWCFPGVNSHVSAVGSGYTGSGLTGLGDEEEYQIVGTTGTFAGTFTQSAAGIFVVSAITFAPPTNNNNSLFFNAD